MAAAIPTKGAIKKMSNEELLALLDLVARDIPRRIKNYTATSDARALLDGLQFAGHANKIMLDLRAGRSLEGFQYGLMYAQNTLLKLIQGAELSEEVT